MSQEQILKIRYQKLLQNIFFEPDFMKEFVGYPDEKLVNLMYPANTIMTGVVQIQDSYMKGKIANPIRLIIRTGNGPTRSTNLPIIG